MAKTASRPRRPAGKRWALLLAAATLLAALALFVRGAAFPRLEIAGSRISRDEYLRAMYQARNEVLSDHAAIGHSLTDWSAPTPLGDPLQLTVDRALELLGEYYAVATLAVERGYLADAGYDAMLRDMEDINRQRREALENGAMVTGSPQFTPADYLTYRASALRLQFCNDPENPEYRVTEQALRERYEADREDLYRQPDDLELGFLLIDAAPGEADDWEAALLELRQTALETESLSKALVQHPELTKFFREISVNAETYSIYARSLSDVLIWAGDLGSGELSQVYRQENRLCLIQCRSRIDQRYAPLEDVASVVLQSIRESRYDELIARRREEATIRGDLDRLYRFTAEQLH